jgi:hypothetical protein
MVLGIFGRALVACMQPLANAVTGAPQTHTQGVDEHFPVHLGSEHREAMPCPRVVRRLPDGRSH